MARSNVPKFGNWENDDNVPYTVYFDKARKTRGGKIINPNDPEQNPDMFTDTDPSPPKPRARSSDEPIERVGTPEHRVSKEEGDFRQSTNSPARGGENTGQKNPNESNYGVGRGQRPGRPARTSGGSEQSFERSPLHPHHQAKLAGRGSGSPAWEGQGRSHDIAHGTPNRSRLRPRGDESPDQGAAVPKFGEWEDDPQSAENFTHIFNKVREEKNTGAGNVPGTPKHPSSYGGGNPQANKTKKCGCFPW